MDPPGDTKGGKITVAVNKSSAPKDAEEKKKDNAVKAGIPKAKAAENPVSFCVYIGPSIRGVIQNSTIYEGSREKTEKRLAEAIKKFPLIAKLISTDKTFAEDRIRVKTAGNLLHVYYKRLASGNLN